MKVIKHYYNTRIQQSQTKLYIGKTDKLQRQWNVTTCLIRARVLQYQKHDPARNT